MLLPAGTILLFWVSRFERTGRNHRSRAVKGLFVGLSGCERPFLTIVQSPWSGSWPKMVGVSMGSGRPSAMPSLSKASLINRPSSICELGPQARCLAQGGTAAWAISWWCPFPQLRPVDYASSFALRALEDGSEDKSSVAQRYGEARKGLTLTPACTLGVYFTSGRAANLFGPFVLRESRAIHRTSLPPISTGRRLHQCQVAR